MTGATPGAWLRSRTNGWPLKSLKAAARQLCVRAGYCSKPAFMIIGAQKAGTTALLRYLAEHPCIVSPVLKEAHFFDVDPHYYGRSIAFYHANFALPYDLPPGGITGEATPEYLYYPNVAARLHRYNPELKLIVLLREPVSRAYSAWNMFLQHHANGLDKLRRDLSPYQAEVRDGLYRMLSRPTFPSFKELVDEELAAVERGAHELEPSFIRRGLYAQQLRRYLDRFPREQLLVLDSRELRQRLHETLAVVARFLGVSALDWSRVQLGSIHERSYEAPIAAATAARLRDFYAPHNDELERLLDRRLGW